MLEKIKKYKFSLIWAAIMMVGCTIKIQLPEPQDNEFNFEIPNFDKIMHLTIYIILAALICIEKRYLEKTDKVKILIISALYGVLIEIIQYFEPWRSFEIADMVADTVGAIIGILISKYLIIRIYK